MDKNAKIATNAGAAPPAWPLNGFGGEAFGAFQERCDAATAALVALNTGLAGLARKRISRDSEVMTRLVQCQSLPELWAAEAGWLSAAFGDYASELAALAKLNETVGRAWLLGREQSEAAA